AAAALRILAAGQIANAFFGPNAALLNMTHHERRVTRAMGIALVLNILGVIALTLLWGMTGAALAFVAALICWNVVAWVDSRRLLGIETSILGLRAAL
ncbi:MAG: polysaccharide biosynthesis C-terminal domain-containing protein, partial [Myxococcales bacterium]